MKLKTNIIMAALALASLTGISQAAVILSGSGNNTGFTVSSSDLLQTQLSSTTSTITINGAENSQWSGGATVGSLTDGLFPTSPNSSTGSLVITGGRCDLHLGHLGQYSGLRPYLYRHLLWLE
jgi:hypothetical protein